VTTPREIDLGHACIGGAFGARPPLLVGSMFYDRHSIVRDPLRGVFDEPAAAALLDDMQVVAQRYAVPVAVDVVAASAEAMERYLTFVLSRTDLPVFINATEPEARLAGLSAAAEADALRRCVYASLTEDTVAEEIDALRRHPPAGVMILASDIGDLTPEGTIAMIETYFAPLLAEIGVDTPIVDVGVMDPPSIGLALRSIELVRARLGYPAGCAFSNCFPQWSALGEMGHEWLEVSFAATVATVRAAGADFLHFGLAERAQLAVHAAATAEVFYGFAARELDGAALPAAHPLGAMLRRAPQRDAP
jgi:tetrahydromethanopterin S-methyltransferase subunit H